MSRANIHDLKNNFGQSLTPCHTNLSGGASMVSPGASAHLRVFKVVCEAPTDMSAAQTVQIQDGTSGDIMHTFSVPLLGQSVLDLGSRSLQFDTSVHLTGAEENVQVTIFYDERPDRN